MARFYTNENIAWQLVLELRALGHDVLTSYEAGNANQAIPDRDVLLFATKQNRILVTYNRRHFLQLHRRRETAHAGIMLYMDFLGQAHRIHAALAQDLADGIVRINRPSLQSQRDVG